LSNRPAGAPPVAAGSGLRPPSQSARRRLLRGERELIKLTSLATVFKIAFSTWLEPSNDRALADVMGDTLDELRSVTGDR
jgi:hypothetical protein